MTTLNEAFQPFKRLYVLSASVIQVRLSWILVALAVGGVMLPGQSNADIIYVSTLFSNTIEKVDTVTQVVTLVSPAYSPDSLLFDSQGRIIYTNYGGGEVRRLDLTNNTDTVLASGLSHPVDMVLAGGGSVLYVANQGSGIINKLDLSTNTLTTLANGTPGSTNGLAFDTNGHLFAVLGSNTLAQLNPITGAVINSVTLPGTLYLDGLTFDVVTGLLYVSSEADSSVYSLDPTNLSLGATLVTSVIPIPDGLTSDGKGNLWVAALNGNLWQYDLTTGVATPRSPIIPGLDDPAPAFGPGSLPSIEKFYTYTNNNWAPRCAEYNATTGECITYRPANVNLDNDVFASMLPQADDSFLLYGKEIGKKTVVTPGQYIAVSVVEVPLEQDIMVVEDFSNCTSIGPVNPNRVPGGVQVVLVDESGDVHDIDDDLAAGIGGSITLDGGAATVHVSGVPAGSELRVMVKFQPTDEKGIIGASCTNYENLLDETGNVLEDTSAVLSIVEKP